MNKVNNVIQALVIVTIFLVVSVGSMESASALKSEIEVSYQFKAPEITTKDGYAHLSMRDCFSYGAPGMPVIPIKGARILLPYKGKLKTISVIPGNKTTLPGTYKVYPGQKSYPLSYKGEMEFTEPDPEVYGSRTAYPGEFYTYYSVQDKKGYQILILNLQPIEYIPQSGILSYFDELTVKLSLEQTDRPPLFKGCPDDIEVDNAEVINSYPTGELRGDSVDHYVIITNDELKNTPGSDNFQALRDSKLAKGLTATIVTTEWIYANYDGTRPDGGTDNQTKIRNFIIDYYEIHAAPGVDVYVLLGGDGDGADVGGESGDNIIPARGFWSDLKMYIGGVLYDAECAPPNIPADMYYSCLNGTFDFDGDGIYGEPNDGPGGGEVDLLAEVYVGRAPVDSADEVSNFVRKTLDYESTSESYLRDVLMAGEKLFDEPDTWGGDHKDEVKYGSCNHGYCTVGFPPYFDVETLYDRDYPGNNWPTSEIIDKINDNLHIINHAGHSNMGYTMRMSNADVDALTNNKPFFGYAWGCYAGSFDNRGPPRPDGNCNYLDYDCILEHFVTSEHGAFAFIGNSRYSWAVPGSTDSPSHYYDRQFWDAIFGEGILNLGKANQDSKEDNIGYIGYGDMRWCYYELNLLGDPETPLNVPAHDTDILIVDDDVSEKYEKYYMNALHAAGYNWDCTSPPADAAILMPYPIVIWLTGDDWWTTLSSADQANLQTYLDSGGKLFVSGQDIGVNIRSTSFYHNYLHADFEKDNSGIHTLNGVTGDPIGDGLTIGISGGDGANNQDWPSEIAPGDETASAVFNYAGDGCGALKADTGTYRAVYFAFGFEAINNEADRNTVMSRVMGWLEPELITNCDALQDMNTNLAGNYYLGTDIDCSGTVNWNGGGGFVPVGSSSNAFTGTFDGRGHKITGLFINRPSTDYVGLFGYTGTGSEIKDVGLEDVTAEGDWYVGGLVSFNEGAITDSYSTGSVSGSDDAGGLVGCNKGAITNSYSASSVGSGNAIGGLVGFNFRGTIENSYSTGSVIGYGGYGCVGGLVGYNRGTITNSYSTGSVSGSTHVGGLVGHTYEGTVTNSYSIGQVTGSSYVGGLIGYGGGATHSYWDIETSGQSSSAGGEGKTTAEMKQAVTFVGWDFTDVWAIIEDVSYPFFGLPDLVITDIHGDWIDLSWKTYNTIYTVKNVGDVATPHECWTNFIEVNGNWPCSCVDPVPIPVLDVGDEVTHTVGPIVMGGDSDCVEVYADYNNTIVEKNE